jgi:hypothetical protein
VCNNGALLIPRRAAALRVAMSLVLLPSLKTTGVVRTKQVERNRSHTPQSTKDRAITYAGTSRVGSGQANAQCPLPPQL